VADAFEKTAVDKSRFPPEVTEVYRNAALRPGAMRSMVNYYRALFRGLRKTASEELPVIETPTLMVWGLEDTALSKETTDGTDEYVTDLTLRFLPDVSHWVQQDAPETVNAMLLAWLADEPVPEAADVVFERLEDLAVSRTT
jgi:pimeloyl-ACP methyl ester carboxylesterase